MYRSIPPDYVALYTIAYIIVLFFGTWPSDYFGRKWMLLVIQILMAVACIIEMFATNWGHWAGAKVLDVCLESVTPLTTGPLGRLEPNDIDDVYFGTVPKSVARGNDWHIRHLGMSIVPRPY